MSSITTSIQECTGGPSQRSKARERNKRCKDWQEKTKLIIHKYVGEYRKLEVSTEKLLEIRVEQGCEIQNQLRFYVNCNHSYKIKLKKQRFHFKLPQKIQGT